MQPSKNDLDALVNRIRQNLTNITAPMNVKWDFNFESTVAPAIVEIKIWNPQLTVTTPRKTFEEIADMSDAQREVWLFPYVVKLAEASQRQTKNP